MPTPNSQLVALLTVDASQGGANLYSGLTDSQVTPLVNAPTVTPNPAYTGEKGLTYVSLGDIWGLSEAIAFSAAVDQAIASGKANGASSAVIALGAAAAYFDKCLAGAGIDPSNPQAQAGAAEFVDAGLVTQDQVNKAFYITSYLVGNGTFVDADVTAARAEMARWAGWKTLDAQRTAMDNAIGNAIDAGINGISTAPENLAGLGIDVTPFGFTIQ